MEHLKKNWKDFDVVGENYIGPNDLKVGDYFMEDTYPEVYKVTAIGFNPEVGMNVVTAHDLTRDQPGSTWYGQGAYAPVLVRLKPKLKPEPR